MDPIVRRLLENKNKSLIDPSMFNIKDNSEESWDLYDEIQTLVGENLPSGIDLDNSGLDSRGKITGDRTIIYKGNLSVWNPKKHQDDPISSKVATKLQSDLEKLIQLPDSDEAFEYSVSVNVTTYDISIVFSRNTHWN